MSFPDLSIFGKDAILQSTPTPGDNYFSVFLKSVNHLLSFAKSPAGGFLIDGEGIPPRRAQRKKTKKKRWHRGIPGFAVL